MSSKAALKVVSRHNKLITAVSAGYSAFLRFLLICHILMYHSKLYLMSEISDDGGGGDDDDKKCITHSHGSARVL